jgi:hypothetical protein
MPLIEVAVSAAVGKQITPTTKSVHLCSVTLTPSAANATIKIRDGNASGEVVFYGRALSAAGTGNYHDLEHRFTKGMHVKVIGTNAVAYLEIH